MDLRRITDFDAPELDVYARLTENQLLNRADPQNALFVAESPLVIGRALDAGCEPVSFLMETKHVTGKGAALLARCPGVPVYLDESLRRFETVYPAAGGANTAVELTMDELYLYSGALSFVDVCKL